MLHMNTINSGKQPSAISGAVWIFLQPYLFILRKWNIRALNEYKEDSIEGVSLMLGGCTWRHNKGYGPPLHHCFYVWGIQCQERHMYVCLSRRHEPMLPPTPHPLVTPVQPNVSLDWHNSCEESTMHLWFARTHVTVSLCCNLFLNKKTAFT